MVVDIYRYSCIEQKYRMEKVRQQQMKEHSIDSHILQIKWKETIAGMKRKKKEAEDKEKGGYIKKEMRRMRWKNLGRGTPRRRR